MDERRQGDDVSVEADELRIHSRSHAEGTITVSEVTDLPFSHFINAHAALLKGLVERLDALTYNVQQVAKGDVVQRFSSSYKCLYLLEDGWACSKRYTQESNIQRLELYIPGDVMGVRELSSLSEMSEITMLTPGRFKVFSGEQITQAYEQSASLRVLFLRYLAIRGNLVLDRLKSCIGVDAPTRIIYLILETHTRLVNQKALASMTFELPLTQEEIGEFVGLSAVHVSRSFSLLEAYGYLKRDRNTIEILNYQESLDKAEFYSEYLYRGLHLEGDESLS